VAETISGGNPGYTEMCRTDRRPPMPDLGSKNLKEWPYILPALNLRAFLGADVGFLVHGRRQQTRISMPSSINDAALRRIAEPGSCVSEEGLLKDAHSTLKPASALLGCPGAWVGNT